MSRIRNIGNIFSTDTTIATDVEVASAISDHNLDTTSVHGISDTADLATKTYVDNAANAVIPSQTGNNGKYLQTDGSITSWATLDLSTKQDKITGVSDTEIGYLDGVTSAIQTQLDAKMPKSGGTFTGTVTLNADPTQALHAATKQYVDNAITGLDWHPAVNVLAASNVPLTGSVPLTVDSHTLSNGYRLLLKGQTTGSENGIYDLTITGGSYSLARSTDADAYTELVGASVFVMEGTSYGSTAWIQTNTYLTSFASQTWVQFSGQGTYTAGNGLTLSTNSFSIDTSITVDKTTAQTLTNKTLTNPVISTISNTGTITLPTATDTLVGKATTDVLTNKSISGSTNTLSNIANSSLTNSSITVNGSAISLGGSATITAVNPNALTIGTGLSGTSYTGGSAVTIAINSTVATLSGTQTFTNKTLTDSTTYFQDETDNTKKLQFQLSGITTGTTRTLTIPDVSGSIITTGDTSTVTNTMLAGSIANAKLTNSSVTIGSTGISLGATSTTLAGLTSVTSTSFVGALTGNADTVTNGVYTNAANTITAASASTKPLVIKGAASQTANLQEWQDSSGTLLMNITSGGDLGLSAIRATGGSVQRAFFDKTTESVRIVPATASHIGLVVKAAASQTADLQQWQTSAGTILAKIDASGNLTAASIVKSGGTSTQFLKADGSVDSSTYLTTGTASSTYQPLDSDLTAIAALASGTGLLKNTAGTWSLDTTSYLSTSTASSTYQPLDADLTSIAALTGTSGFLKTNGAGTWSVDTATYLTSATGVTTVNGSSGAISNIAVTNSNNNFSAAQTITGSLTATSIVKSGGASTEFLKADGSVDTSSYATTTYVDNSVSNITPEIVPLDDLSNYFNGIENRFMPTYQGSQVTIQNPYRLLLTINGIIQYIDSPDYVWMSGISRRGFTVDSDGYLAFSEPVPEGSEFDGRLMSGPTTTTKTRTYPFRALDIILGG